jgi:aspartokinase
MQEDEINMGDITGLLKLLEQAMTATINHTPKEYISEINKALETINQTLGKNYSLIEIAKLIFVLSTVYRPLYDLVVSCGDTLIKNIAIAAIKAKEAKKDITIN